jgi:membrane-bound serine protease (ClpP class)
MPKRSSQDPNVVPRRRQVRRLSVIGLCVAMAALVLGLWSPAGAEPVRPSAAQTPAQTGSTTAPAPGPRDEVVVLKVSGLLDPILADFIERSIHDAERAGVLGVVLQVKSSGSVLTQDRFERLATTVRDASIPVSSWVGPSANVRGRSAQLVAVTDDVGISPNSSIGDLGEIVVDGGDFGGKASTLLDGTVGYDEAPQLGVARQAPTIGHFLVGLDGFRSDNGRPLTPVLFSEPTIFHKMLHTVASPPVAYLLFLIGLGLLVFELYTAGVGIAGVVGAGSIVLGCYGLDVLSARWWAVALLVIAMFGFAVDVQIGVPRFWTAVGVAALVVGSLALYNNTPLSWITLIAGIAGVSIGMISGMPAMVRTRFSTPTIGRDWMIGEMGVAESPVDPDGVVRVRDALWRARTNRATPITAGGGIRVVEINGLILEVEPEEGGARDYRERRTKP